MTILQQQQVIAKCKAVFAKATELYPHLKFDKVRISFDLRGRSAGQACARGGFERQYMIKFNRDMLGREAFDHVINNTVPHEIAHIVCFMDRSLGKNHDAGWANVCKRLGGNGVRYHQEEVVRGKGYTYEYVSDRGHKVRFGDKHHRYLQGGSVLTLNGGKGTITKDSQYSIVGQSGRTLANPIVRNAQPTKEVPVAAIIAPTLGFAPTYFIGAPEVKPVITAPKPVAPVQVTAQAIAGESKAAVSRRIMLAGHRSGRSYEEIIEAMIAANGYTRQLARGTYKANAAKVGVPLHD